MRLRLQTLCSSVRATVTVKLSIAAGLGTLTTSLNVDIAGVVIVGDVAGCNTLTVPANGVVSLEVVSSLVTTMSSHGSWRGGDGIGEK